MTTYMDPIAFSKGKDLSVLNTGVLVRAGQFVLHKLYFKNRGASENFLKLYDTAAAPTSGDTPYEVISMAAGESGWVHVYTHHQLGFGYRASTGIADNNNVAPGANEVMISYAGN